MIEFPQLSAHRTRLLNRLHARMAARARGQVRGFVSSPEPRTIGSFARGRQLAAGNFLFAGSLITAPENTPWEVEAPDTAFSESLHGFAWLDDLAAVGDSTSRRAAQKWLWEWIDLYGGGQSVRAGLPI